MSARKNVLAPHNIITAGSMSGALTSDATSIQYMDNICIELVWTGTPTGTFSIEGSLTYQTNSVGTGVSNAGTWVPITLTPPPAATGSAGSILLDLNQLSFPYIRVKYSPTSGSGTLTATIGGKQL
jgi:hypothetical protein